MDEAQKITPEHLSGVFFIESVCKPGSVLNDHLSSSSVAERIKPSPEDGRVSLLSSHDVAPDRVYSTNTSPCGE